MQTKKFAERWDEYNCNKVTVSCFHLFMFLICDAEIETQIR